jgi:hypothetical protein
MTTSYRELFRKYEQRLKCSSPAEKWFYLSMLMAWVFARRSRALTTRFLSAGRFSWRNAATALVIAAVILTSASPALAQEVTQNSSTAGQTTEQQTEQGQGETTATTPTTTQTTATSQPIHDEEHDLCQSELEANPQEQQNQQETSENPTNTESTETQTQEDDPCSGQAESTSTVNDDSTLTVVDDQQSNIEIINTNDIAVTNEVISIADTGNNAVAAGDDIRNTTLETGNINVYANVLTILNNNMVNSDILQTTENFNNLSNSLFLNQMETNPAVLAQDLVTGICSSPGTVSDDSSASVQCFSFSSFKLTNNNTADVNNNVGALGNSGLNQLYAADNINNSGIKTGNVNAVVNILNIVNTNLYNSRLTVVNFNVFGDWTGDLVMPSELYFTNAMSVGNNSAADVALIKKVVFNISNENQAKVENNVNTGSSSGDNSMVVTDDKGDVDDSSIATGSAQSGANVKDVVNTNIVNGKWYLGLVNTLGNWSGNVYSLPNQVAMAPTDTGLSFFATNAANQDGLYRVFDESISQINSESETQIDLNNTNNANVVNNVDVLALSGQNNITSDDDIRAAKIQTGNTKALANILNFINTNLIHADVQIGMVNIFGRWTGNILFGYPDLSVNHKLINEDYPGEKDKPVEYELNYSNSGDGSISDTQLEWHYDPLIMALQNVTSAAAYEEKTPGVLLFNLGRLAPSAGGTIKVALQTIKDMVAGATINSFARIFGVGPERTKDNNASVLNEPVVTTRPSPDQGGNTGGGNGGSSGDTGGSSGGGSGSVGGGTVGGVFTGGPSGQQPKTGLVITKTNNTGGASKKAGDTISFTISIDNYTSDKLGNVIIYDTLRDPSGTVISNKKIPLGDVKSQEGADITYQIQINSSAAAGYYTNSAYAEGLGSNLALVRSNSTATSTFMVGTGLQQSQNQEDSKKQVENNNETVTEKGKVLAAQDSNGLEGKLVKIGKNPTVYLVSGGVKLPVTYQVFLMRRLKFQDVQELASDIVGAVGKFLAPPEGTLVRTGKNPTVYWVVDGRLHPINWGFYVHTGLNIFPVVFMSDNDIRGFEKGPAFIR